MLRRFQTGGPPILIVVLASFLVAGTACSRVPVQTLHTYSDAFAEAREAGSRLYEAAQPAFVLAAAEPADDIEPAAGTEAPEEPSSALFPETLDRRMPSSTGAHLQPDIRARIAALDAVAYYNEVLMQLASGATSVEVRSGVSRFADSALQLAQLAGAAFPGGSALAQAVSGLAEIAERVRAEAEAKKTLLEGAPYVDTILEELDKDVDRLYALQVARFKLEINSTARDKLSDTSVAMLRFAARHQLPAEGTPRAAERQELNARFAAVWENVEDSQMTMLEGVHGDRNAEPYGPQAAETMRGLMAGVEGAALEYQGKVAEWQAYQDALRAYSAMLDASRRALAEAVRKASAPVTVEQQFYTLLGLASEVRGHAVAVIENLGS